MQSDWFHGVVHHHPKIIDTLLKTVEDLKPSEEFLTTIEDLKTTPELLPFLGSLYSRKLLDLINSLQRREIDPTEINQTFNHLKMVKKEADTLDPTNPAKVLFYEGLSTFATSLQGALTYVSPQKNTDPKVAESSREKLALLLPLIIVFARKPSGFSPQIISDLQTAKTEAIGSYATAASILIGPTGSPFPEEISALMTQSDLTPPKNIPPGTQQKKRFYISGLLSKELSEQSRP
jgi:hypothetical protein